MADTVRTLVVDDTDLQSIRLMLDPDVVQVVGEAESGEQALELLPSLDFDAAVIDFKMPGINGCEVAAKIKEVRPDAFVVILTSYDVRAEVEAFDYVDHYHEKISIDSLSDVLRASKQGPAAATGKKRRFGRK